MWPLRITSAARKHKLTRTRILHALDNSTLISTAGDREDYIGVDNLGVELEMSLIPDDRNPSGWSVIHAMPTHYRNGESNA